MGGQRPEMRSTYPTRKRSNTTTCLMGTRILIGAPSGAVTVLRRTNERAAEAMGLSTNIHLRRRRQSRRHSRKR